MKEPQGQMLPIYCQKCNAYLGAVRKRLAKDFTMNCTHCKISSSPWNGQMDVKSDVKP